MLKIIRSRRGEGYIDVAVLVLAAAMVLALAMSVLPVFMQKQRLDTFAAELVREAEISGRIGEETAARSEALAEQLGINPDIAWSCGGNIQLGSEVVVTLTVQTDIGLFGSFGSYPVTLTAKAAGKSEVYWR